MLFHLAVGVEFSFFLDAGAGVVFLEFVDGLLIVVQFLEEGFQVRQLHLRFERKIEDALADASVDVCARDVDRVGIGASVQLDLAGDLDAALGPVVAVENLLVDAAHRRRFLHQQVRVRIEEELMLHARSGGQFHLQGVLPAHLRVPDERDSKLVRFQIQQARICDLRLGLHLHGVLAEHRNRIARGVLSPSRLAVVGLDDALAADDQLRVVAVWKLRVERCKSRNCRHLCRPPCLRSRAFACARVHGRPQPLLHSRL